jgi:hypothetical protein
MKSIIFGLSLASAAVAQIANGVSMVSLTATPTPSAANNGGSGSPPPYQPPASQVTQAPSSDYTQAMPYSSYMSGGYKSLNCGYGYSKQSDGSCKPESWVRRPFFFRRENQI